MRLEIGHSTPLKLLSIALFPGLWTQDQKWILRRLMLSTFFVTFDWFNAIFEQSFEYFATLLKGQQYTDTANTLFQSFIIHISLCFEIYGAEFSQQYFSYTFEILFLFHYRFYTINLLFQVIYQIFHYRVFWNASGVFLVLNDEEVTSN